MKWMMQYWLREWCSTDEVYKSVLMQQMIQHWYYEQSLTDEVERCSTETENDTVLI